MEKMDTKIMSLLQMIGIKMFFEDNDEITEIVKPIYDKMNECENELQNIFDKLDAIKTDKNVAKIAAGKSVIGVKAMTISDKIAENLKKDEKEGDK